MRAKKSLGQNFLTSGSIAGEIARTAITKPDELVLEIGPGKGVLTRALLDNGARVIAVEKDPDMAAHIEEHFPKEITAGKLTLAGENILSFDRETHGLIDGKFSIAANIPYYITGQILRWALGETPRPHTMVLMVQKEVADRIIARDGKESILSLSVKAYGTPKYLKKVPARYFRPSPKVDSAIISISHISGKFFKSQKEESRFFNIIKKAFAQKRKQVGKLLVCEDYTLEELTACSIDPKNRAEDISLKKWQCLLTKS